MQHFSVLQRNSIARKKDTSFTETMHYRPHPQRIVVDFEQGTSLERSNAFQHTELPLDFIMASTLRLIGHKIWCRATGDASEPQRQHVESLED
jgi:hypothetical protein